jgi:AraC-like DNA-binding protein
MAGYTAEEISDSGNSIEWRKSAGLYDLLADLTGNEQIGLAMGNDVALSVTGMVGFMMQASNNLETAVKVYCSYGHMVCPMIVHTYKEEGSLAIIELHQHTLWKTTYPRSARIAVDFILASTIHFMKLLSGRNIYPQGVELEYAKNAVTAYTSVLKCPVLFHASLNRMIFRSEDLQTPILTSDLSLYQMFQSILAQKKALAAQSSFKDTVKYLLLMQFKGQIPTIEDAAGGLEMTVRSLQRKLADEETSFREVAAEVKKELALHLMQSSNVSITEVASILGYNDLPAFRRAFKGWTNATPKSIKTLLRSELQTA